jgi:ABC-type nitrate/sulfonate/bicarbonate transport system permease component
VLELHIYTVVASVAAVLSLIAGRVFAIEGQDRLTSLLAPAYVGAGIGLMSGVMLGSPLALVAQLMNTESSTWFDALDVASQALLWGTVAGAAAGLLTGILVVMLPFRRLRQR